MKSIYKVCMPAVAAAFAFAAVTALAQSSMDVKEGRAQMRADEAALQRQIKRLDADEARLRSDTASGRMSAESKDAFAVYQAEQAAKGEKQDIAADKAASPQMKSDKAALQRQLKRLRLAEARLNADKASGKMAAESRDSEKVYRDQQAINAEKKGIANEDAGSAQLHSDRAALERQMKRLDADQARLKSDTAAGKMSAESRDAYQVYEAKQAIKGEKKAIAADADASPQMDADKAALQRQLKRLDLAEARLQADKASGRMAAESKDSEKVYKDQQAIKGEKKDLAADRNK